MTVEIYVKCDGRDCHNSREINADTDTQIEGVGYGIDHVEGFCYCPECWPEAKEEIKERNNL